MCVETYTGVCVEMYTYESARNIVKGILHTLTHTFFFIKEKLGRGIKEKRDGVYINIKVLYYFLSLVTDQQAAKGRLPPQLINEEGAPQHRPNRNGVIKPIGTGQTDNNGRASAPIMKLARRR